MISSTDVQTDDHCSTCCQLVTNCTPVSCPEDMGLITSLENQDEDERLVEGQGTDHGLHLEYGSSEKEHPYWLVSRAHKFAMREGLLFYDTSNEVDLSVFRWYDQHRGGKMP